MREGFRFYNGEVVLGFILGLLYLCDYSIVPIGASIHEYRNEFFTPQLNAFLFHGGSEGLFASKHHEDHDNHSSMTSPGNKPLEGKSFIRFEGVTFKRTEESAKIQNAMQSRTGLIEAIVFEVKDTEKIGGNFLKTNSNILCCTPKLASEESCTVGEVIIQKDENTPEWPKRIQTFFEGNKQEAKMQPQSVDINKTGMYYLYFMYCDPELKGTVISGRTVWRNPEGYLPGKMVKLMTFYGFMSLGYLVLGLGWFLRFVQFWKDIMQLHYHISAVIALGMCEMALWYFDYSNLGSTGSRPFGITVWAVTISAVKKTLSRLLLLVVAMGYGVVRPTLGGVTSKVMVLGVVYFVATEALELVENLGNINDFSGKSKLYLVLPVAFLDAWFILWIFSSLSKTLEKLQMRRSIAKLEVYRKFTNALALFCYSSEVLISSISEREKQRKMSGAGKKVVDVAFKASKSIDWDGMAKMIVTDEARKEFSSLRRAFEEVNSTLQTKFSQEPEPIDWEYYRKGLGSRIVDSYKEYYESVEIPKFVDKTTPEYKPKFDALLVELKEAEQKSLKESERLEKEIADVQDLKKKLSTMTADEYFEKHPELKKKFDDEIRNDYWGY